MTFKTGTRKLSYFAAHISGTISGITIIAAAAVEAGALALLFVSSPFIPDSQENQIKAILPYPVIAIFLGTTCGAMAASWGASLSKPATDQSTMEGINERLEQVTELPEPDWLTSEPAAKPYHSSCNGCKYLAPSANFDYPCAVHPCAHPDPDHGYCIDFCKQESSGA